MKSYTCFFGSGRFESMARALGSSIRANAPEVHPEIERVEAPASGRLDTFSTNTEKLGHWRRKVDELPDGEHLVLLDGDTLVLHPLAPAFEQFVTPIAMTRKASHVHRMAYNCGVIFVRGGPEARTFFARWVEVNARLFANRSEHAPLEQKHGGMNQAAWGCMRETCDPVCALVSDLPCAIWNACYPPLWSTALTLAHVVHYKSDLRASIWTHGVRWPQLTALWRGFERDSRPETMKGSQ